MVRVSATQLRKNLLGYLEQVNQGETVVIELRGQDIAQIKAVHKEDWRKQRKTKLTFLVPVTEAFQPLEDWKELI